VPLPELDSQGRLPVGRHAASLDDVRDLFVTATPNVPARERIFRALDLHLERLVEIGGHATVWINGGFVTHKPDVPADVDLVYLCSDDDHMSRMLNAEGVFQLLTLQGVAVHKPIATGIRRLQPVTGLVDAFLARPSSYSYWDGLWSVANANTGTTARFTTKGYLEVEV
jgi:uncharacterized protein DUF6932